MKVLVVTTEGNHTVDTQGVSLTDYRQGLIRDGFSLTPEHYLFPSQLISIEVIPE